jgi:hypothetical protein
MTVIFLGNQLFIQAYTCAFYTSSKPNDEQTRLKATIANNLWVQRSYHEHNSHKKSNQRLPIACLNR